MPLAHQTFTLRDLTPGAHTVQLEVREPEPDVSVIRGRTEDYSDQNPDADAFVLCSDRELLAP
jgi:hypothetical protein